MTGRWLMSASLVALAGLSAGCSDGGGGTVGEHEDAMADPTEPGDTALDAVSDGATEAEAAAAEVPVLPAKVRFVHFSDVHVRGGPDDYYAGHAEKAVAKLNSLDFAADLAVVTGDLVDFIPDGLDPSAPSNYTAAVEVLQGLKWPVQIGAGNHEYYQDADLSLTADREARDHYLAAVIGAPLDRTFDVAGVRFVLMNSQSADPAFENKGLVGAFTTLQLAWLEEALDGGLPTFLFMHHPPTADGGLCDVIHAHPGLVKAIFAGHLHGFWRGEACGVPYLLASDTAPSKTFYYLVEYDREEDRLAIVNEADLPFGQMPEYDCDPASGPVVDPDAAVGTHQVVRLGSMVSNLPGLEGFTGDQLSDMPFVLHIDGWDEAARTWRARLTFGKDKGGFSAYVAGMPCPDMDLSLRGACATGTQVAFDMNILPILSVVGGIWIDPTWVARIEVESLWIEGHVTEEGGVPRLDDGLVHLAGKGTRALEDLKGILVSEYCAGDIGACQPGTGDMPACPDGAGPEFFEEVPESCDVPVGSLGLRFVLSFLSSYPLDNVSVSGEVTTEVRPAAGTVTPGSVDEKLFSTEAGMNCAPP